MGIWFVGAALGNVIASLVAGRLENLAPAPIFHQIAVVIGIVGIFAVLLSPGVKKLMAGVK
jgi:POT family proton-dependent oligopeptide transporter